MPANGTSEPLSSLSSADVSLPFSSFSSTSQDKQSLSPTSVPNNIRPNTLNTSGSDAYWFAHAADPPHERIPPRQTDTPTSEKGDDRELAPRRFYDENQVADLDGSPVSGVGAAAARARGNVLSPGQNSEAYWFAHAGGEQTTPSVDLQSDSGFSEYKEDAAPLSQKEREERFRIFKERQEEERQRRLHELQQQSVLAQKFREQQEEERKRKIDDLRQKDFERRMAVEERKRQIWEAEQERKEAILRRNLDREAKIEARRNAQRNSMSFAFGSSTPRVIDLDLGGFGRATPSNPFGTVTLMPSVNGRRVDENDFFKRRAPSTDLLDQKTDTVDGSGNQLSPSYDSLWNYHKRSTTDPYQLYRRTFAGMSSEATKACLTIPDHNHSSSLIREHQSSTSHYDLWSNTSSTSFGWLTGSGVIIGDDPMSRSMVILPSASRGRRRTDLTPTIPWERESSIRSHSPASSSGLSVSKRAVSMSRLDILSQPRRRYVVDHSPSSSNIASSISHGGGALGSTSGNTTPGGPRTTSSSMSKSMFNLANSQQTFRRGVVAGLSREQKGGGISTSMLHIAGGPGTRISQLGSGAIITKARVSPSSRPIGSSPTRGLMSQALNSGSLASNPQASKRMSQSMVHLASRPPPRPTRASRLRVANAAQAQQEGHSTSILALNPIGNNGTSSVSELPKDSPSRPRSSMSAASEMSGVSSMASTISMRSHSGPRRPRPASMVAAIPDGVNQAPTPPQRLSRTDKKSLPVGVTPPRPPRAKSAGPDAIPVPPPKPPPRRSSPSKSISSEQVTSTPEKPVASVLPNTIESNSTLIEAQAPTTSLEKDLIKDKPEESNLNVPSEVTVTEVVKSAIIPSDVAKLPKQEEATLEQQVLQIPGTVSKPRITSEEEAKAALAEKRRLAREQAEREAKMERLRQEELKRQEEERIRQEEEEQRRFEEEQIRLAGELRKQEEEKLQRAIKEQEEREAEERRKQEEETKLKAEKEEQEKKAREEAEKLRKETEEKLKKEEEERAERKKRVEQIMKRTRAKTAMAQKEENASASEQSADISAPNSEEKTSNVNGQGTQNAAPLSNIGNAVNQLVDSGDVLIDSRLGDKKELVTGDSKLVKGIEEEQPSVEQNGLSQDLVNVPSEAALVAKSLGESHNILEHFNGSVLQTNGYSNESFSEEKSEIKGSATVGNLLDFDSLPQANQPIGSSSPPPPPAQFDELFDLSQLPTTTTQSHVASNENEVNLLNRETDDLNSNRMVSNNPFIAFEDNVTKKQESSFTDLLS